MTQDVSQRKSPLAEVLCSLTRSVCRHRWVTLGSVFLLACASVGVTAAFIRFQTERADLIDSEAAFHQRWLSYTESFGNASDIVVVVEADHPEKIKQVLDELGSRMTREPEMFQDVLYKVEPDGLRQKGLQYLSPPQLETGLERLKAYRPVLDGRWELLRLDLLVSRLRQQLQKRASADAGKPVKPLLHHADLLAGSLAGFLDDRGDFRSPWPDVVPIDPNLREEAHQVVYLLNDQGTMGFLKAFPVEHEDDWGGASRSIRRLRELMAEVSLDYPEVRIGATGIPVLENDEMRRSQQDMVRASVISALGVGLLLVLGFRGVRHPLLALIMLAVGMAWAFGYTTLAVGHLNILSVSFAVILIGLGIDFAIHYLARYLEYRHRGRLLRPALLETSASVGTGIVAAAVTTALAFLCAVFTQFQGVAELGVIAGGGILLCAAAAFVVLPPLISLSDQHTDPHKLPAPCEAAGLRRLCSSYSGWGLLLSAGVLVGIGMQVVRFEDGKWVPQIQYDSNLLHLQADGVKSVDLQRRVFDNAHTSLLFAVSLAETAAEARQLRREFEALPTVHHVEELGSRLPAYPPEQTKLLVQAFRAMLADLPDRPEQPAPLDPESVGRALEGFYRLLRSRPESAAVEAARSLDRFLDGFAALSFEEQMTFLSRYQMRMQEALLGQFRALAAAANPEPVEPSDLPPALTSRFVSPEGKWLVQVYPKNQVWDIEPLRKFVRQVRSVDPDVTGTPLQNYEASRQIFNSYKTATLYALAVICLVLLLDFLRPGSKAVTFLLPLAVVVVTVIGLMNFRGMPLPVTWLLGGGIALVSLLAALLDFPNFRDTALALLPPLGGGTLMFGILAVAGIDLNPANLIVLPLVLGIGVDDGVHVIHDFRYQQGPYRPSPSTINAIVLTSLTSMIGFGSLMLASHRGLASVGLVLVIGVGSCLFVSLVTLPAILTLVSRPSRPTKTTDEAQPLRLATDAEANRQAGAA